MKANDIFRFRGGLVYVFRCYGNHGMDFLRHAGRLSLMNDEMSIWKNDEKDFWKASSMAT